MPAFVVTGASSGIGEAVATDLARRGYRVFGTVRHGGDGERLAAQLGMRFQPVVCDVTDIASLRTAAAEVEKALADEALAGLVCNAGISLPGPLLHQPIEELNRQWAVNSAGFVASVQAFAPLLGARENFAGTPGRIVAISSVQGKLSWPFVGGYAASKHALEAFCHALRRELMIYGVDVVIVAPGPVITPIWEKSAGAIDRSRYEATGYGPILTGFEKAVTKRAQGGLAPEAVAEVVHTALTAASPRTRYAVVRNKLSDWTLPLLMPDRMLDRMVKRVVRLVRKG